MASAVAPSPSQQPGFLSRLGTAASEYGTGLASISSAGWSDLARGGREIAEGGVGLLGDFFRSLMPTREGAEAGGRVVSKLGDIGAFLTGGADITGPRGVPRQIAGRAAGLDVGAAPRGEIPPSQLALPAPPGERLGLPSPSAGRMPPHMNVQPLSIAPPLRQLLPPATTQVPGQPWLSTEQGMIPGTPQATMREPAEQPSVAPGYDPRVVRFPQPRAPVEAPPAAAPDLGPVVPQHPGVVYGGRQAIVSGRPSAAAQPPEPLVAADAHVGQPSRLAQTFAENDPYLKTGKLIAAYKQAVKPGLAGKKSMTGLSMADQRIATAVDAIIDNPTRFRLLDSNGQELPAGRLPRSLYEFGQAIDQLKGHVFEQYDNLAKQQTGGGVRIPLTPAIAEYRRLAAEPEVALRHPEVARAALAQADRFAAQGSLTPLEMQNTIQSMNQELAGTIRAQSHEVISTNTMNTKVLSVLRDTLNKTMDASLGTPQYQALRNRLSSLLSIEGDVVNALVKQARARPGGVAGAFAEPAFWYNALHGVITGDISGVVRAGAIRGAMEVTRIVRSPNRAISKMFSDRARQLDPTRTERASAEMATAIGTARQRAYDAARAGNLAEYQRWQAQQQGVGLPGLTTVPRARPYGLD